jgi:hypothetical protein
VEVAVPALSRTLEVGRRMTSPSPETRQDWGCCACPFDPRNTVTVRSRSALVHGQIEVVEFSSNSRSGRLRDASVREQAGGGCGGTIVGQAGATPSIGNAMPHKFNDSRRHKIPMARYRVTNWPEYDAALVRRGSLTVWFTEEAVEAWHAPATGERGGQPIYSATAIETGLALRLVFHQPRCVRPRACCGRSPICSRSISPSRTTRH